MNNPFNLYITGVGGQGVLTLAKAFWKLCELNGLRATGSVIKGGAQRLGTVSATLRIFPKTCLSYRDHSVEIPKGCLDLMIGLEPWESLRARWLCRNDTKVLVNRTEVPLLVARTRSIDIKCPVDELAKRGVAIQAKDYTRIVIEKYGDKRMLNYEMGKDAVRMAIPEFSVEQFDQCFKELIANAQSD